MNPQPQAPDRSAQETPSELLSRQDALLDLALEETFPASDAVAVMQFT